MRARLARSLLILFLPVAALVFVPATGAAAATITVTTTADEYDTGTGCSLREAIKTANDNVPFGGCSLVPGGGDTITVPAGSFTLTRLGTDEDAALNGDLDITEDVTISGAGARTTIVDGNRTITGEVVFGIPGSGDTVTIQDVTIRNGNGGVFVQMGNTMNVLRATISDNPNRGIENFGTLNATDVTFTGNTYGAGGSGGALGLFGPTTLTNVTLSGNSAGAGGGAIYTEASLTIKNSTIVQNTADNNGNDDGNGGGIYRDGGTTTLTNTILANNVDNSAVTKHADCSGAVTSDGYNLIEDTTGCSIGGSLTGNVTGSDPGLGALQDNGGPTDTHALPSTSPVFDAGNPAPPGSGPLACPAVDQRGVARPQFTRCDIGAFELQPTPPPQPPSPTPIATCLGKDATVQGTDGPDQLAGTGQADVIAGLGGDDTIRGLGAKDRICAGAGDDSASGQGGADQIRGEAGDDRLMGQGGDDLLKGGGGDDKLKGGGGEDRCRGGSGKDKVRRCDS